MKKSNGVHDLMFNSPNNLPLPSTSQTVPVKAYRLSSSFSANFTPTLWIGAS